MPFDQHIPRPLNVASVRRYAPETSGVFGISTAREWVYIGETDNIREALSQFIGASEESVPPRSSGFVFEVCRPVIRLARQNRLIQEYEPSGNRRHASYP